MENRYAIGYGKATALGKLVLDGRETAIEELRRFSADGGNSIVELSCGGLHPDPNGLVEVVRAGDVHIVMGCRYYVEEYQNPANQSRSVDDFAAEKLGQIERGAWGTAVRDDILGETGCQATWTGLERRVIAAAAEVQRDAAVPVWVRKPAYPASEDPPIAAGESAVAGLAALEVVHNNPVAARALELNADSCLLLIGSEGVSDADVHRQMLLW